MTDLPDLVIYAAAAGAIIVWTLLVVGVAVLIARFTRTPDEPTAVSGELDLFTDEELRNAA